ncbi:MAG: flagellar basal body rod protein FlgB [bacterium]|nr:flagellar basal body rod protein FlgB [bacterium]
MIIDYDAVINKLAADLDNRVMRHKLIASNVANVDTPGYTARDLKFHRILTDNMDGLQLKRTHEKHLGSGSGEIRHNEIVESPNPGRPDGNNVNIDEELLKLSENNIQYNVSIQLLTKKLKHIKDAMMK